MIDAPDCCDYCPVGRIFGMMGQVECMASNNIRVNQDGRTIPNWCPIHDAPQKADHPDYCDNGRYDKGWNDCLDQILNGA